MLKIRDLTYTVEENGIQRDILDSVDLDVDDGRFVVITGPNGGGKTTLAKAIMGLVKASGSIEYNGTELSGLSITERAKLGISYGFQQPPRFKGMRVLDLMNIAAGTELKKNDCCRYLTQVGLCAEDYISREVDASLSGGEVKRIEIATILARGASLMIFDEPEAGIDLWSFQKLTETFRALHMLSDSTIIIISHQERIIRLADEIILVAGGEIRKRGPVDEIFPYIMADTVSACPMEGGVSK